MLRLMSREAEGKSIYGAELFVVHQPPCSQMESRGRWGVCVCGLGMRGFKADDVATRERVDSQAHLAPLPP